MTALDHHTKLVREMVIEDTIENDRDTISMSMINEWAYESIENKDVDEHVAIIVEYSWAAANTSHDGDQSEKEAVLDALWDHFGPEDDLKDALRGTAATTIAHNVMDEFTAIGADFG